MCSANSFFSNSCFSRYLISTLIFFFWDKLWVAKLASDHLTASPKQAALHITWESVTTAIGGDPCSHPNGFTSAWGVWFTLVLSSLLLLQFPVPGTSFPLSLDNHLFFPVTWLTQQLLYHYPFFDAVSCYNATGFCCISANLKTQGILGFVLVYLV